MHHLQWVAAYHNNIPIKLCIFCVGLASRSNLFILLSFPLALKPIQDLSCGTTSRLSSSTKHSGILLVWSAQRFYFSFKPRFRDHEERKHLFPCWGLYLRPQQCEAVMLTTESLQSDYRQPLLSLSSTFRAFQGFQLTILIDFDTHF